MLARCLPSLLSRAAIVMVIIASMSALAPARADMAADEAAVKAQVSAFYDAVSALDIARMAAVWAPQAYVTVVNPRSKAISHGWDATREAFDKGVMSFWAEFKATQVEGPYVHVNGDMATALTYVEVAGKTKDGKAMQFKVFSSQVFERHGEKWLLIANHGSRVPE